jgi:hypothetical protein
MGEAKGLLAQYGIEVVAEEAVKVDTKDFGPALTAETNSNAHALMGG